jgi:hypothetical protein
VQNAEYPADLIPEYGATEQPAIAARMAPHLRMTYAGAVCAAGSVVLAVAALAVFPFFTDDRAGLGWAIAALVAAVLMLAICLIQVAVWRRAMASWRGQRLQDLHAEARLSWFAHLASYLVALLGLLACMAASAEAGWRATAAVLLAVTLLLILAAQVLAGVQFLRPSGPPGTLPAHMRRIVARSQARNEPPTPR